MAQKSSYKWPTEPEDHIIYYYLSFSKSPSLHIQRYLWPDSSCPLLILIVEVFLISRGVQQLYTSNTEFIWILSRADDFDGSMVFIIFLNRGWLTNLSWFGLLVGMWEVFPFDTCNPKLFMRSCNEVDGKPYQSYWHWIGVPNCLPRSVLIDRRLVG